LGGSTKKLSWPQRRLLAELKESTAALRDLEQARAELAGKAAEAGVSKTLIAEALGVVRQTLYNRAKSKSL
jgi:DNA invertase Pin-like site-specific DNA recombinase